MMVLLVMHIYVFIMALLFGLINYEVLSAFRLSFALCCLKTNRTATLVMAVLFEGAKQENRPPVALKGRF